MFMVIPLTPSARLSHHRESFVVIRCGACGHQREVTAESLARIIGWEASLFYLRERFRCSQCDARRVEMSFVNDRRSPAAQEPVVARGARIR